MSTIYRRKRRRRSDNSSKFIASEVQEYFRDKHVKQEFTKPATPQQEAHIEAYHFIMESCVCQRFEFNDLNKAIKTLQEFINFIILREYMEELIAKALTNIC